MNAILNERAIADFWQHHPCGEASVGGSPRLREDYDAFFTEYDRFRYHVEPHILPCLDRIAFRGKRTLEIGLGQGSDSEQIIRRGAAWFGMDLTAESVARVKTRLSLRQLPYESIAQGSVLSLPYADDSFDLVFSHGVLHHVPDICTAQCEIHRVLRPGGELIVMVYARRSLNYLLSISVLRRLALASLYGTGWNPGGIVGQHLANARQVSLRKYLHMENFVHKNTDGPLNPYSKVYDLRTVQRDFPAFDIIAHHQHHMHAPPLPVGWLPLARWLGWHLWVHLRPV